jgi:hypothetical protein
MDGAAPSNARLAEAPKLSVEGHARAVESIQTKCGILKLHSIRWGSRSIKRTQAIKSRALLSNFAGFATLMLILLRCRLANIKKNQKKKSAKGQSKETPFLSNKAS